MSILLALVLLCCRDGIVRLMDTPPEAIEGTRDYLMVCFIGIPFIMAYNVIASIFRGLGDSKSPMYFVAVACVVNILLDFSLSDIWGGEPEVRHWVLPYRRCSV